MSSSPSESSSSDLGAAILFGVDFMGCKRSPTTKGYRRSKWKRKTNTHRERESKPRTEACNGSAERIGEDTDEMTLMGVYTTLALPDGVTDTKGVGERISRASSSCLSVRDGEAREGDFMLGLRTGDFG
jgi:hypothetical protein